MHNNVSRKVSRMMRALYCNWSWTNRVCMCEMDSTRWRQNQWRDLANI